MRVEVDRDRCEGNAVCVGMGWFRTLAAIGLAGALLRLVAGWLGTSAWASAEPASSRQPGSTSASTDMRRSLE